RWIEGAPVGRLFLEGVREAVPDRDELLARVEARLLAELALRSLELGLPGLDAARDRVPVSAARRRAVDDQDLRAATDEHEHLERLPHDPDGAEAAVVPTVALVSAEPCAMCPSSSLSATPSGTSAGACGRSRAS